MLPILFHIPYFNIPIYSYGLMMVIGFLGAVQLAKFLARRSNLDPELFVNAALIALVAGVAGARISHVLENWADFTRADRSAWENFRDMINIRSGGLTYYGGFLLAFPVTVAYGLLKKAPIRLGMDIIAPCLMIGLGVGRIGCLLNGCCYGGECDLPWGITYPYHSNAYLDEYYSGELTHAAPAQLQTTLPNGIHRLLSLDEISASPELSSLAKQQISNRLHPAQIYSTITAFMLALLLTAYFTIPHSPGRVFALMMMLEGLTRYLLELLRVEPPVAHLFGYGLSLSMLIGMALVGTGAALWLLFGRLSPIPPAAPLAVARAA